MPISLDCRCGATLRVKEEHAGLQLRCPVCGRESRVPSPRTMLPLSDDDLDEIADNAGATAVSRPSGRNGFRVFSGVLMMIFGVGIGLACAAGMANGNMRAGKGLVLAFMLIAGAIRRIKGEQA